MFAVSGRSGGSSSTRDYETLKKPWTNDAGETSRSWREYAPWWPDKNIQNECYVSQSQRNGGCGDYKTSPKPSTVNPVPNPQTAVAPQASYSARALEVFCYEDDLSIAIEASRVEAGVEPWAVAPSQESKSKSASSAASS